MTNQLGHLLLSLSFGLALLQSVMSLAGAHRLDGRWITLGRRAAYLQFLALALAFAALTRPLLFLIFHLP